MNYVTNKIFKEPIFIRILGYLGKKWDIFKIVGHGRIENLLVLIVKILFNIRILSISV